ncbi:MULTISPECIES: CPBP family intramembrane glutamic endopeptidase [Paenibacillus]|uniref:CAAX prenyl protease 2/Lysostaphin resistance protein A-like domain-containing protein n=2 Tax=Paenibacillus TaxID=44249 RepID=A0ABX3GV95_PAEBO|nr:MULTISPECIES: CPBP family intramembrane glutamic endopeptidase [Paenibacillus]AIQ15983.1 hypothetical protein H70357_04195 [Paenibacillus sp. FSL H7-0357]OMD36057.1 hypothetical protein BSK56_32465 [Paenibacillus borealis]
MHNLFRNKNRQIRAGWEILLLTAAIFAITMIVSFGVSLRVDSRQWFDQDGWVRIFKSNGLYMLITVWFTVRVLHKLPLISIGLPRPDGARFIQGFISGMLLLTCISLLLWGFGSATFQGEWANPQFMRLDMVDLVITAVIAGICEEILFRGFIQHLLASRVGLYWAVAITSVLFSLAHMANPGYNGICFLNIVLIALIFSTMVIRTGNLYFAIALHISWNLFQGYVLGIAVSGNTPHGLYSLKLTGADWMTGGDFGVEGSLVTTLVLGLVFVFMLLAVKRGAGMRNTMGKGFGSVNR